MSDPATLRRFAATAYFFIVASVVAAILVKLTISIFPSLGW